MDGPFLARNWKEGPSRLLETRGIVTCKSKTISSCVELSFFPTKLHSQHLDFLKTSNLNWMSFIFPEF